MKSITFIALALAAVSFCQAEDDGQYHPELYKNSGNYRATNEHAYPSLALRNGKYGSIYNAYQPAYYQALNRELLTPFVKYGSSVEQATLPTTVTYRTPVVPVVSTYSPVVYSTPKPFVVNTKSPVAVYHKSVSDGAASIIRDDRSFDENNYRYAFETNNGIAAEESGVVDASVNGVGGGTRVRGFYEYIGDDGLKYRVDYIADENGFRASGAHLPKAP